MVLQPNILSDRLVRAPLRIDKWCTCSSPVSSFASSFPTGNFLRALLSHETKSKKIILFMKCYSLTNGLWYKEFETWENNENRGTYPRGFWLFSRVWAPCWKSINQCFGTYILIDLLHVFFHLLEHVNQEWWSRSPVIFLQVFISYHNACTWYAIRLWINYGNHELLKSLRGIHGNYMSEMFHQSPKMSGKLYRIIGRVAPAQWTWNLKGWLIVYICSWRIHIKRLLSFG